MPYPTEMIGAASLYDGLIQTLYGVSLELEGAAEDVFVAPEAARVRIELAIDRLAVAIGDVRRAILAHDAEVARRRLC